MFQKWDIHCVMMIIQKSVVNNITVALQLHGTHYSYTAIYEFHKECVRDKPDDRTATCRGGKVLKLERWSEQALVVSAGAFLVCNSEKRRR